VDILDHLKSCNISYIDSRVEYCDHCKETINYPEGFRQSVLRDLVKGWLQGLDKWPIRIVVDISGLPRSVIIGLADVIDDFKKEYGQKIEDVLVAYTSPRQYPYSRYPQDIGVMKGFFTGRALQDELRQFDKIVSVTFPSIQGFEGKLLYDSIGPKRGSRHILLLASTRDFMTSMKTMRANQSLLQQTNANIRYCFSITDGLRNFYELVRNEENTGNLTSDTLFLVGPFGPKPFAWAACCICKELRKKNIQTEIALSSGFQYISLYSIGASHVSIFKVQPLL